MFMMGFLPRLYKEGVVNGFFLLPPGPAFEYLYIISKAVLHFTLSSLVCNLVLHPDFL